VGRRFRISLVLAVVCLISGWWAWPRPRRVEGPYPGRFLQSRCGFLAGLITEDGRELFAPRYGRIHEFDSGGLAAVRRDEGNPPDRVRWGWIDRSGREVIPSRWEAILEFGPDGWTAVCEKERWGFVDRTGKVVIEPRFESVMPFDASGLAHAVENGKVGFINRRGEWVIKPEWDSPGTDEFGTESIALVQRGRQFGWIDRSGKLVVPLTNLESDDLEDGKSREALALGLIKWRRVGKVGWLNRQGETVIPFEWDEAELIPAWSAIKVRRRDPASPLSSTVGLIDLSGRTLLPADFGALTVIHEELAIIKRNDWYGLINRRGELLTPLDWHEIRFEESSLFGRRSDRWSRLGPDGRILFPLESGATPDPFDAGGMARFKRGGKVGWVERSGATVIEFEWDEATPFDSMGLAAVRRGDRWGFLNRRGQLVIAAEWLEAIPPESDGIWRAIVRSERGWGLINAAGEVVVEPAWDEIRRVSLSQDFVVRRGDQWGLVDAEGRTRIPTAVRDGFGFDSRSGLIVFLGDRWDVVSWIAAGGQPRFDSIQVLPKTGDFMVSRRQSQGLGMLNRDGELFIPCVWENIAWDEGPAGVVYELSRTKHAWAQIPVVGPLFERLHPRGQGEVRDRSGRLIWSSDQDRPGLVPTLISALAGLLSLHFAWSARRSRPVSRRDARAEPRTPVLG
jgi:hypothetical protein